VEENWIGSTRLVVNPVANGRIKGCIGADFSVRIIANDEFGTVIDEVQSVSDDIDDVSELFLHSYQLLETCKKMS